MSWECLFSGYSNCEHAENILSHLRVVHFADAVFCCCFVVVDV